MNTVANVWSWLISLKEGQEDYLLGVATVLLIIIVVGLGMLLKYAIPKLIDRRIRIKEANGTEIIVDAADKLEPANQPTFTELPK